MIETLFALLAAPEHRADRGATAPEYGLLVAGIAIAIVAGATAFGGAVTAFLTAIGGVVQGWPTSL